MAKKKKQKTISRLPTTAKETYTVLFGFGLVILTIVLAGGYDTLVSSATTYLNS